MTPHFETISEEQRRAIAELGPLMRERAFYLAGGTAVAICLGHRRSVDLDWFTTAALSDPAGLAADLRAAGQQFSTLSVQRGALHVEKHGVRISAIEYPYGLLAPLTKLPMLNCDAASLRDLAAMKLLAVTQRGSRKDFVDVYALGRECFELREMMDAYCSKFAIRDTSRVVYSLTFFVDADAEPPLEMIWAVDWNQIKSEILHWVQEYTGK